MMLRMGVSLWKQLEPCLTYGSRYPCHQATIDTATRLQGTLKVESRANGNVSPCSYLQVVLCVQRKHPLPTVWYSKDGLVWIYTTNYATWSQIVLRNFLMYLAFLSVPPPSDINQSRVYFPTAVLSL